MSANFDDLFDAALAHATAANLQQLHVALSREASPASQSELLTMLFESWMPEEEEEPMSEIQAEFVVHTLELRCGDTAVFRKALNRAVRRLLPPYLNKPGLNRTIGINDANVSIHEAVRRFRNLLMLNTNTLAYLRTAKRWGTVSNLDAMGGTAAFVPIGAGNAGSMPIATLLSDGVMFQLSPETRNLSGANHHKMASGAEYRATAGGKSRMRLTDDEIREIAFATYVPTLMSEAEFETWWNSASGATTAAAQTGAKRRSCDARSIQEMALLLAEEGKNAPTDESYIASSRSFFERLKPDYIKADGKQLATVIALLSDRLDDEQLGNVLSPLADKCGFLPANPAEAQLQDLAIYGEVNVKTLTKLFGAFRLFMSEEYLAGLAVKLPMKALTAIAEVIDEELLFNAIRNASPNADVYMFIWKNRAKRTKELLGLINLNNVVRVLNQTRLPKEWMVAVRELKNTLMDKADFQEFLLQAAHGDVKRIPGALQGALTLGSGERQSLIVKFSRLSKDLQAHLESGAGEKLMSESRSAEEKRAEAPEEPMYSSVASIRLLKNELDNIINVEQPKNREALKTARAHGDFRENSEFDAAKERRNFLTRRRNELERILMQVQAITFATVKIDKFAVIGSTVTLEYPNGEREVHHLLGAWDGNPEKHYLSYKTRLGEAIFRHEVGSTIDLPGGKRATIAKVEPLSKEILAEMDE